MPLKGIDSCHRYPHCEKVSWRWRWRLRLSSSKAAKRNGNISGAISDMLTPLQLDHYWSTSSRISFLYIRGASHRGLGSVVRESCDGRVPCSIIIPWRSCANRGSVMQVVDPSRKTWGSRTTVVQRRAASCSVVQRRAASCMFWQRWPKHADCSVTFIILCVAVTRHDVCVTHSRLIEGTAARPSYDALVTCVTDPRLAHDRHDRCTTPSRRFQYLSSSFRGRSADVSLPLRGIARRDW